MMNSAWWIRTIDHRVSTGIIFFVILMFWAKGEKRSCLPLRKVLSFFSLCATNWILRYQIDTVLRGSFQIAWGYSMIILVMCLVFAGCYFFCYRAPVQEYIYCTVIAVTVYRLAWNLFKSITAVLGMMRIHLPWSGYSLANSIYSYCIYFAVILLCYAAFRIVTRDYYQTKILAKPSIAVFLIFCQMLLEFLYRYYGDNVTTAFMFYLTALLYCLINYALLLVELHADQLQQENNNMQAFIHNKQQYYQISRDGIISLQTKCHDLKHQIACIRSAEGKNQLEKYMNRLEDSIDEYNTVIETGNEYVDVVLTEKNIICTNWGIKFTYIIDGSLFNFMTEMDAYALFGNIMDNAIESMVNVADPQKRYITLKAAERNDMVLLVVENYYDNELKYQDGIPVTNKPEKHHHGFGLRSIMNIAQSYGGRATIHAENHVFRLTVTMRPPAEHA